MSVLYGNDVPEAMRGALAHRVVIPAERPEAKYNGDRLMGMTEGTHGLALTVYPLLLEGEKLCAGPADDDIGYDDWWEYPEPGAGVLALLAWPDSNEAPDGSPWQPSADWRRHGTGFKVIRA